MYTTTACINCAHAQNSHALMPALTIGACVGQGAADNVSIIHGGVILALAPVRLHADTQTTDSIALAAVRPCTPIAPLTRVADLINLIAVPAVGQQQVCEKTL